MLQADADDEQRAFVQPQVQGVQRVHAARLDALEFVDDQHERLAVPCAGALRRPQQRGELARVPAVLSRHAAAHRRGADAAGHDLGIELGGLPELVLGIERGTDGHEQADVEGEQLRLDNQRLRATAPAGFDFGGKALRELRLADAWHAGDQRDAALRVAVFSNQLQPAQHRREFRSPAGEVRRPPFRFEGQVSAAVRHVADGVPSLAANGWLFSHP